MNQTGNVPDIVMDFMEHINKTILITGATGLVGTALQRHLQHYNVRILTTNKHAAAQKHFYYWNPGKREVDLAAFEDVSVIMHLAGAGIADKRWTPARKQLILESRVAGLQFLSDILKSRMQRPDQLICAGGIGWYGDDPGGQQIFREDAPPDTTSFLGEVCKEWEAAAFSLQQLGIAVAVLRTGMVMASEGGALQPIVKSMFSPVVPVFGNGRQQVSWIHIEDLAAMYVYIMEHRLDGVYNAVADEVIQHTEMIKRIARFKKGNSFIVLHVPSLVLKVILGQLAQELLLSGTCVSNDKIKNDGFSFRYPLLNEDTLASLL